MKLPKSSGKPRKPNLLIVRRVSGGSMLPNLQPGCLILATGRYKFLEPGDLIIIEHDGLEKIKRLQYVRDAQVFVTGDNEAQSTDSRSFGWLPIAAVKAKVVWPKK